MWWAGWSHFPPKQNVGRRKLHTMYPCCRPLKRRARCTLHSHPFELNQHNLVPGLHPSHSAYSWRSVCCRRISYKTQHVPLFTHGFKQHCKSQIQSAHVDLGSIFYFDAPFKPVHPRFLCPSNVRFSRPRASGILEAAEAECSALRLPPSAPSAPRCAAKPRSESNRIPTGCFCLQRNEHSFAHSSVHRRNVDLLGEPRGWVQYLSADIGA